MGTQLEKDKRFLKLIVARHLLEKDEAQTLWKQAQEQDESISTILIDKGILTQHVVDQVMLDVEKSFGPKKIAGFRIVQQLGQGGMGSVYKAVQESVDREVALKVMVSHFAKNKDAGDRFLREARTAGKVNHPNVISIIDVGQENGQYYMALELVSGGDAEQLCHREGGRLSERRALEIIRDACKGLEAIHQVNLVHRDIKPANIFISDDGTAKLADLGLARSEAGEDRMTQTGATVGTPAYMSPEQAEGVDDLDIRSDIYALGATLYALVCGEPPYTGNSAWAVVAKAINDPIPDASMINQQLSHACLQLINDCMDKDRSTRIADPQTLLLRIQNILDGATQETLISPKSQRPAKREQARKQGAAQEGKARAGLKTPSLIVAAVILLLIALSVISEETNEPAANNQTVEAGNQPGDQGAQGEPVAEAGTQAEPEESDEEKPLGRRGDLKPGQRFLSSMLERVNRQIVATDRITAGVARQYSFAIGRFGEENSRGPIIEVDGFRFPNGLAMHPPGSDDVARATFKLDRRYKRMVGGVALNDSSRPGQFSGSLVFVIKAGLKEVWRSEPITSQNRKQRFDVRLPHSLARRLILEVHCEGNFDFGQGVWLDPVLKP